MRFTKLIGFRFSIGDLLILTTLVALMVGLPLILVQSVVISSLYVCFFSGTGLLASLFTWNKRQERAAIGERFFIHLLSRLVLYSLALILIGTIAIVVRSMSSS